jgi:hypothetical protein
MIAKSRAAVDIAEFERFFDDTMIEQFHNVRRRGGYVDQPLWNLLVDSDFFPAVDLLAGKRASRVTSVTGDLNLQPDGAANVGGLPVLLLHLASPALKKSPRYRYLLDGMLLGGLRISLPATLTRCQKSINFYSPGRNAIWQCRATRWSRKCCPKSPS